MVQRAGKPVALFVDEAHDLHAKTLNSLKRLMEVVSQGGGTLSVVLIGHPKLKNDLRRPTMEEIGYRTDVLAFDGLGTEVRSYLEWLLLTCLSDGVSSHEVIAPEALDILAGRLTTPLQLMEHLNRAFEEGFKVGEKPLSLELVESVLSPNFDNLEARLTRLGYSDKVLAKEFYAKPTEIRRFLDGQLEPNRARDLTEQMRAAGLPL